MLSQRLITAIQKHAAEVYPQEVLRANDPRAAAAPVHPLAKIPTTSPLIFSGSVLKPGLMLRTPAKCLRWCIHIRMQVRMRLQKT